MIGGRIAGDWLPGWQADVSKTSAMRSTAHFCRQDANRRGIGEMLDTAIRLMVSTVY